MVGGDWCRVRKKSALKLEPWRTSPCKGFAEEENGVHEEGREGTDSQNVC